MDDDRSLRSSNVNFHNNYNYNYGSTQLPFYSEDFIAGFTGNNNNQMSVVRRFFCLFVMFDLIFVGLMWVITVVISGENIYKAIDEQIIHYQVESSLFDVVVAAGIRFLILETFYGIFKFNHWIFIALTTSCSCGFLIFKVLWYTWPTQQPVFQVVLIICSFVISWFEVWFLDSRVIPSETYSRTITSMLSSGDLRSRFLQHTRGQFSAAAESYRNFYSPIESDDEDEEFKHLGTETVQKAYNLLELEGWKVEKVTSENDTISTIQRPFGKVYKLKARVEYSPKLLLSELFYNIEEIPKWNPTLLESKIIRKIDNTLDVAYSVSASGGGGLVKSRDFVNLRCWKLIRNGRVDEDYKLDTEPATIKQENEAVKENGDNEEAAKSDNDEEIFSDAQAETSNDSDKTCFMSAAMSIDYPLYPPTTKYIRGDNIISCWAMKPIPNDENACTFEWLLCIDLKGSLPKYVLNTAFVSLMNDYMQYLRAHIQQLKRDQELNCA